MVNTMSEEDYENKVKPCFQIKYMHMDDTRKHGNSKGMRWSTNSIL